MNFSTNMIFSLKKLIYIVSLMSLMSYSFANDLANKLPAVIDDFSHANNNNLGIQRQFLDDKMLGGHTQTDISIAAGKMHVKGEIVPPRGQPGWSSSVLLLNAEGSAQDVSQFKGVRLRVKISKGHVSLSANSTEITNFDYHAALLSVQSDNQFHEITIPFTSMKRAWSQQTPLNPATISSLSIVAFGVQKSSFDFELDEISFY